MENIFVYPNKLIFKGKEFKCAIGKGGIIRDKKEGDGATPMGCFPIRKIFFREDKIIMPQTVLPVFALSQDDGWCDDINDANYNKLIKLPYSASHENLWREDDLYDLIVVFGYNDEPVVRDKGSAIFMHIARPDYLSTAGCVAVSKDDLFWILKNCEKDTQVCIMDK